MTKFSSRRRTVLEDPEEVLNLAQRWLEAAKRQVKWLLLGTAVIVAVLAAWSVNRGLKASREDRATAALVQLRPQYAAAGANAEAAKALKELVEKYPGTKAAYEAELQRANLLYRLQNYAEAAKSYEALLKQSDPAWTPLISESLSYCYEGMGDFPKALATLQPVEDQSAGALRGEVMQRLALLAEKAGDHQAAAAYWRKLLDLKPTPAMMAYLQEKAAVAEAQAQAPQK